MNAFWNFVVSVIASPVTNWNYAVQYNNGERFFIAILAAILVWVIPLIILTVFTWAIVKKTHWLRHREHCQHCQRWTIGPAGEQFVGCNPSEPCCAECYMEHKAAAESQYHCPVDGTPMTKVINHLNLIIDKCPGCQGVWLSGAELQHMLDDAEEDGEAAGMLTGIAVGVAIN